MFYEDVLNSPAWACLSPAGRNAYFALMMQKKATNNGDLSLPLSKSKHYGIKSPATLVRALRELRVLGFIAKTREGGFNRSGHRAVTLYRMTEYECYEQPKKHIAGYKATHDWRNIEKIAHGKSLLKQAAEQAKIHTSKSEAGEKQPKKPTNPVSTGATA